MQHQVEMWRTVRWLGGLLIIGGIIWFLIVLPAERMMTGTRDGVADGLRQVLATVTNTDTRIVEGRAEIVGTSEVSELALLEMRMSATRTLEKAEYLSILPLGTKKITVRGNYDVKGGYRLKQGASLRMENGLPVARFPKPEILSVELVDFEVINEDSGWMNKIKPEDRAQILRELRQQMRRDARENGMLDTVESTLRTRLRDLLGAQSVSVEQAMP